ncbi:MAG: type III-A CRISPR-associated RAMP protein Csm5 [Chloroflexota bacterium]|nr:type III-A CRISPR-associated RAMP protein Csm5 [Chloroflexota bacterium]
MTVFNLQLDTLSPIHIGDGDELRHGFDFVTRGNITYRLDIDKVLEAKEDEWQNTHGRYPLPGELLDENEYRRFARYALKGTPRSGKYDARVKSFIKDVFDHPYIPGSSLKGALRTALAWHGWDEVNPRLKRHAIGHRRSWAGQKLERKFFGPDPQHDLLRALQVSDLVGLKKPGQGLILVNAQVLTKEEAGSPIELEALRDEVTLKGTIKIDDTLFEDWAEPELHFQDRQHWLEELMPRVQAHSVARLEPLIEWFEQVGITRIAKFYRRLADLNLGEMRAVLQLGWGGGWDSKTFGSHLKEDQQLFKKLLRDFRMQKGRSQVESFPVSKRVVVKDDGNTILPLAPFGWVLLTLDKRKRSN